MNATVRFTTDLGAEIEIPLPLPANQKPWAVEAAVLDAMRHYGRRGWRAVHVPPGGFQFPLANHEDFDWSLLGAQPGQKQFDGEEAARDGVWLAGDFYSRRDFEEKPAVRGKGAMPAAIRYSRGARPTDPPELREKGDGDFEYVTLVNFRGSGGKRDKLALRAGTPAAASLEGKPASAGQNSSHPSPTPAPETVSLLDSLENTPDHLKAVLAFICESDGRFDSDATLLTVGGEDKNLRDYARSNWERIKTDFTLAIALATRLEAATTRRFALPVGV